MDGLPENVVVYCLHRVHLTAESNIFIERLWRSVKYEEIYLKEYEAVDELRKSLAKYFHFYNQERPHQTFGGATPLEVYRQGLSVNEKAA
jgi:transposase InsO family protein